MGKLSNSFIKGIGFGLGRGLSNELIRKAKLMNSDQRVFGLSTKGQWYAILLWILMLFPIGYFYGLFINFFWFLLGLIPCIILIKVFYKK